VTTLAASSASSNAEPGTLAFLIVFALAVVVVFLFRSMSKQLRKVNAATRQDEPAGAKDPARAAEPRKDS
jgi:NADH:ubiquinone oxidoreductase subunit 6 (subunit J)